MGGRRFALLSGLFVACAACGALFGAEDVGPDQPAPPTDASDEDAFVVPDATSDVAPKPDACASFDLATDGQHCGSCDHDCLGTPCAGGVCQPQVLASPGFEEHLVVAGDRLVARRSNGNGYRRLVSIPKSAPSTAAQELDLEPLATNFNDDVSGGIVFDAPTLYWGTQGSIRRMPPDAGPETVTPAVAVKGFFVAGAVLGWSESTMPNGAVRHCDLPACAAPQGLTVPNRAAVDVVVLGGQRYFFALDPANGAELHLEGGPTFATAQTSASRLVTDGTRIYWAATDAFRAFTPPSTVVDVVTTPTLPERFFSVAVDADSIWLTRDKGVDRCDRALPCTPAPYAATADKVRAAFDGIAVDASFVYWLTFDGKVVRVRKPR